MEWTEMNGLWNNINLQNVCNDFIKFCSGKWFLSNNRELVKCPALPHDTTQHRLTHGLLQGMATQRLWSIVKHKTTVVTTVLYLKCCFLPLILSTFKTLPNFKIFHDQMCKYGYITNTSNKWRIILSLFYKLRSPRKGELFHTPSEFDEKSETISRLRKRWIEGIKDCLERRRTSLEEVEENEEYLDRDVWRGLIQARRLTANSSKARCKSAFYPFFSSFLTMISA